MSSLPSSVVSSSTATYCTSVCTIVHNRVVPRIQYSEYGYKVVWKSIDQNIAKKPLHQIREELADYMDLLLMVIKENLRSIDNYLRYVATKDHYRAKLLDSLSQISNTDTTIQTEKESILQEVTRLDHMFLLLATIRRWWNCKKKATPR